MHDGGHPDHVHRAFKSALRFAGPLDSSRSQDLAAVASEEGLAWVVPADYVSCEAVSDSLTIRKPVPGGNWAFGDPRRADRPVRLSGTVAAGNLVAVAPRMSAVESDGIVEV